MYMKPFKNENLEQVFVNKQSLQNVPQQNHHVSPRCQVLQNLPSRPPIYAIEVQTSQLSQRNYIRPNLCFVVQKGGKAQVRGRSPRGNQKHFFPQQQEHTWCCSPQKQMCQVPLWAVPLQNREWQGKPLWNWRVDRQVYNVRCRRVKE